MKKLIGFVVGMFLMVGCSNPVSVPQTTEYNSKFSSQTITTDKELQSVVISSSTNLFWYWYSTSGNPNDYTVSYRINIDSTIGVSNIAGIYFMIRAIGTNDWYEPNNPNPKYNFNLKIHAETSQSHYIEITFKSTATAFYWSENLPFRCVILY